MKIGSVLFSAIVASVLLTLVFFGTQKFGYPNRPPLLSETPLQSNIELQKTESALKRLESIRFGKEFSTDRLFNPHHANSRDARAQIAQALQTLQTLSSAQETAGAAADAHISAQGAAGAAADPRIAQAIEALVAAQGATGAAADAHIARAIQALSAVQGAAGAADAEGAQIAQVIQALSALQGDGRSNRPTGVLAVGAPNGENALFPFVEQNAPGASASSGGGYSNPIGGVAAGQPVPPVVKVNTVSLTYVSKNFRRAVVDGELVREGHFLPDGTYVSRIRQNSVVLTRDDQRREVAVPKSMASVPPLAGRN